LVRHVFRFEGKRGPIWRAKYVPRAEDAALVGAAFASEAPRAPARA
jgi:hypothetical protein